eukprot:gene5758-11032_t
MVAAAGKDSRCWIKDGDPSQHSVLALNAMRELNSELLSIPPRSPDTNPIENLFGIAKRMLGQDVIDNNITVESIEACENRIRRILNEIPVSTIDSIIESQLASFQPSVGISVSDRLSNVVNHVVPKQHDPLFAEEGNPFPSLEYHRAIYFEILIAINKCSSCCKQDTFGKASRVVKDKRMSRHQSLVHQQSG